MRQTELNLNKRDRRMVDEFRSEGLHRASGFNRAHILAALDRKVAEPVIMEVLSVGRTAIWRTRAAYLEGGLNFALHDEAPRGRPKRYEADVETQITARVFRGTHMVEIEIDVVPQRQCRARSAAQQDTLIYRGGSMTAAVALGPPSPRLSAIVGTPYIQEQLVL